MYGRHRGSVNLRPVTPSMHSRVTFLALGALLLWPVAPRPLAGQQTLRVVAYNIKHGRGMDGQVDLERVAAVLRGLDADVITLQEVDRRTERTGDVDQVAVLGELLGMRGYHGAHRRYQGGEYGNAILTRLPALDVRTRPIPPAAGSALAVHELVVPAGRHGALSIVSVHLAGAPEERRAQADSLTSLFADAGHPVVLAGDFNARPGDLVLRALEERWQVVPKDGDPNTFPSDAPDREIDFVMFTPQGAFEVVEHRVIDERLASDHRPILAVLRIW